MKGILFFMVWIFASLGLHGQAPEFEWVGAFGGNIYDAAYDVATDRWGNVYTTGGFRLTADADFGPGEHLLQAGSVDDIYIAKYAPDRTLLWVHCFSGGYDGAAGIALATDTIGHVYLLTSIDLSVRGKEKRHLMMGIAILVYILAIREGIIEEAILKEKVLYKKDTYSGYYYRVESVFKKGLSVLIRRLLQAKCFSSYLKSIISKDFSILFSNV